MSHVSDKELNQILETRWSDSLKYLKYLDTPLVQLLAEEQREEAQWDPLGLRR